MRIQFIFLMLLIFVFDSNLSAREMDLEIDLIARPKISTTKRDHWWKNFIEIEAGEYFLYGSHCRELETMKTNLSVWSGGHTHSECSATTSCIQKEDCGTIQNPYLHKINVTNELPGLVRERHLKEAVSRGPNCWNLVFQYLNAMAKERYVSAKEFHNYVEDKSKCRKIRNNSDLFPGAVVAIRDLNEKLFDPEGGGELHGFIYGTPKLAFSKNGPDKIYPYELQPIERIWATFSVAKECQQPNHKSSCQVFADYYDCR